MNNYKVSWMDGNNNEWFSDDMNRYEATKLYNEICNDKVDDEQVKACLYAGEHMIQSYINK